jgi:DnaJ-class molecular chaperone
MGGNQSRLKFPVMKQTKPTKSTKSTNAKKQCDGCNGSGEVEKTIYRGDEGMEIEMNVMVECHECDGKGTN